MQNSMRKVVAIALFLLSLNAVLAQSDKGLLVGRVMSETGRALVGVKLFVTGTQDSGVTDVEGKFSFSVAVGARKVFVEAEGHDLLEDSIFIESGKEFYLNPVLSKTTRMEGAEIVKKKKAKENTVAAAIQTKQLSPKDPYSCHVIPHSDIFILILNVLPTLVYRMRSEPVYQGL